MKVIEELKPNYAPVYAAALYPDLAMLFHEHGYALAVHGSLARDFDLIAVPWAPEVSAFSVVFDELLEKFNVNEVGNKEGRYHGRVAYTLSVGFGECAIDLSVFPVPVDGVLGVGN